MEQRLSQFSFNSLCRVSADERPSDPFGNDIIEINGQGSASGWNTGSPSDTKCILRKLTLARVSTDPGSLLSASHLQSRKSWMRCARIWGEALLGHLNISINLMIKPAPGNWVGPFEAVTMKNGNCKSYSLAKYAAAQEVGISPDHVRLVIVHLRARNEDHMVVAVFQNGEWFILDNRTNVLDRDWEKSDYEPLVILDYKGVRRYVAAF